jgi:hypothetical protein
MLNADGSGLNTTGFANASLRGAAGGGVNTLGGGGGLACAPALPANKPNPNASTTTAPPNFLIDLIILLISPFRFAST